MSEATIQYSAPPAHLGDLGVSSLLRVPSLRKNMGAVGKTLERTRSTGAKVRYETNAETTFSPL